MSKCRRWMVASLVVAVMAVPRAASADDIWDWIYAMSGPQLIGVIVECWVGVDGALQHCSVVGRKVAGSGQPTKIWFSLGGGAYVSTGKNSDGQDYEFRKNYMLAFEPMLMFQTAEEGRVSIHHGVGVSGNFLFGEGGPFLKGAIKIRPIGLIIGRTRRVTASYNLRLYPRGFSADEFGKAVPPPPTHDLEVVQGASVGFRW